LDPLDELDVVDEPRRADAGDLVHEHHRLVVTKHHVEARVLERLLLLAPRTEGRDHLVLAVEVSEPRNDRAQPRNAAGFARFAGTVDPSDVVGQTRHGSVHVAGIEGVEPPRYDRSGCFFTHGFVSPGDSQRAELFLCNPSSGLVPTIPVSSAPASMPTGASTMPKPWSSAAWSVFRTPANGTPAARADSSIFRRVDSYFSVPHAAPSDADRSRGPGWQTPRCSSSMATIASVSFAAPSVSIMTIGTVHLRRSRSPWVSRFAFSTAWRKCSASRASSTAVAMRPATPERTNRPTSGSCAL